MPKALLNWRLVFVCASSESKYVRVRAAFVALPCRAREFNESIKISQLELVIQAMNIDFIFFDLSSPRRCSAAGIRNRKHYKAHSNWATLSNPHPFSHCSNKTETKNHTETLQASERDVPLVTAEEKGSIVNFLLRSAFDCLISEIRIRVQKKGSQGRSFFPALA